MTKVEGEGVESEEFEMLQRASRIVKKLRPILTDRTLKKMGLPDAYRHQSFDELADERDIYYCYRVILGRNPDPEGWRVFSSMLGNITVHDLSAMLLKTGEFKGKRVFQEMAGASPETTPVKVDLDGYSLYVLPNDQMIGTVLLEQAPYEPHVTKIVREIIKPGMNFVDIGANIGYFSLLAAHLVGPAGKVIAIEPNQYNCGLLYMSAVANQMTNVDILPFAVAEKGMTLVYDQLQGTNGVTSEDIDNSPDDVGKFVSRTLVRAVTLDDLLDNMERIEVVKIDIEGAEYRALMGGTALLKEHRPVIISEFFPGLLQVVSSVSGKDYLSLLVKADYRLSIIADDGNVIDHNQDVDAVVGYQQRASSDHIDILACPIES
ncbi:MAG: FkbM family methyltransferase [Chloroflexi bacterium]|nr:FkbM family methyltransferase [Chloroflexota bacterium]